MAKPKTTPVKGSQHAKRAEGKTQTSISMREDLLELARQEAAAQGRSLSNWLEQMLRDFFEGAAEPQQAKATTAKKAAAKAVKAAKPAPVSPAKRPRKKA